MDEIPIRGKGLVFLALLFALWAMGFTSGCRNGQQKRIIRLSPEGGTAVHGTSASDMHRTPLRVAMAPIVSPRRSYQYSARFLDYLAERLGRPAQRIQRNTYAEINHLLRQGACDIALVGSYAYVQGQRDFGMQRLVAPIIQRQRATQAYVVVPYDSPARRLQDLRGKIFAFTDPLSMSGYLCLVSLLQQLGETPGSFFERTVFTYGHDKSMLAVEEKLVDGAVLHSLVYQAMLAQDPSWHQRLRIIHKLPGGELPVVVVHPRMPSALQETLKRILLQMHEDPKGASLLQEIGVKRFEEGSDMDYLRLRQLLEE